MKSWHIVIYAVVALLGFGLVTVYSVDISAFNSSNSGYRFTKHLLWILTGGVLLAAMANVDYHYLKKCNKPILVAVTVLLVLVLMPGIGVKINGARRWLRFSQSVSIQPSEFAKLAVIIFLAAYIEKYHSRMSTILYGFVIPLAVVMIVAGLVAKEPDFGTAAFIVMVSLTMLIVGGARIRYVLLALLAITPVIYKVLFNANSYKFARIMDFVNSLKDPSQAHYQIKQSLIAIGSGGVTGLGLGSSKQKLHFLPESSSDFVFTIICEEFGFIGVVVIISLFLLLVWQGLKIIHRTKDLFGFFLGLGVIFMFGLQAIVNIAVVSGSAPAKGIPLPFISSGGSSLLFSMMAIGILVNIARKAEASAPLAECREAWDATEDAAVRRLPSRIWHSITIRVASFSW
ncbi:MAG: ftsW [Candidatus Brocadiaceae bacterium]|nr:ftsW [Candidatus Brocadiaceae bacterium]